MSALEITMAKKPKNALLITVTGADQPGITAELSAMLATAQAELLDVEQVQVQGYLNLHFLVALDPMSGTPILKDLLWKAKEFGLDLDFEWVPSERSQPGLVHDRWAVTLVARVLGAEVLAAAATAIAQAGFNIDRIGRLSEGDLNSLELLVSGPAKADPVKLQRRLMDVEAKLAVDVALQRENLLRRSKRLVVFDMDSTLIQHEVIDEIARIHGVYDEVSATTERAMQGEMNFDEALRARVALLEGAPEGVFARVLNVIKLTPGAERMVRVLKRLGYRLALVSGGFIQVAQPLANKLGLDYAFANELEVRGGKLTGKLVGPIVNKQRKADLLESMALAERITLEQVIAVGDGANDLAMLGRAGLGIAFNAKRIVQEQADTSINQRNLDAVLYLLGIRQEDVRAVEA